MSLWTKLSWFNPTIKYWTHVSLLSKFGCFLRMVESQHVCFSKQDHVSYRKEIKIPLQRDFQISLPPASRREQSLQIENFNDQFQLCLKKKAVCWKNRFLHHYPDYYDHQNRCSSKHPANCREKLLNEVFLWLQLAIWENFAEKPPWIWEMLHVVSDKQSPPQASPIKVIISSVGWVSDYRAGGLGFEPWPDQHSGS